MTHNPNAKPEPVRSHSGPMSAHLGLILHVTTNHGDPRNYFNDPAHQASSTWWISDTGLLVEYVDPDLKAWAQAAGNATYNSVETSGTPDQPMTAAQVETLAKLYAWGHGKYGWPFTLADKPGQKGLGWHGMGGAAWGGHLGCPGDKRKAQRSAVLKRAQQIVTASAPKPAAKPRPVRRVGTAPKPAVKAAAKPAGPPSRAAARASLLHRLHLAHLHVLHMLHLRRHR